MQVTTDVGSFKTTHSSKEGLHRQHEYHLPTGTRLIVNAAVEVDVFLGRARFQRAADCPERPGGQPQRLLREHGQGAAGAMTVASSECVATARPKG